MCEIATDCSFHTDTGANLLEGDVQSRSATFNLISSSIYPAFTWSNPLANRRNIQMCSRRDVRNTVAD
jgi:hypothetical protein